MLAPASNPGVAKNSVFLQIGVLPSQLIAPAVMPNDWLASAIFKATTGGRWKTKIITGIKTKPPPMALRFPMIAPTSPVRISGQRSSNKAIGLGAREKYIASQSKG